LHRKTSQPPIFRSPVEQEEDEWTAPLQKLQGFYNINVDEDDDPKNVNITETKG
jgi:hypothetical protein